MACSGLQRHSFGRAYVAYIAGILINVVGFAGASKRSVKGSPILRLTSAQPFFQCLAGRTVPIAATRIYEMSFFTGFGISMIVYLLLNWAFPVLGASQTFEEVDVSGWDSQVADDLNSADSRSMKEEIGTEDEQNTQ